MSAPGVALAEAVRPTVACCKSSPFYTIYLVEVFWLYQYGFKTPFRVTSGLQARVPRTHATWTKQDCGAARGEVWQHTTTHKRSLFIKQDRARPPGCAMLACAYRVCSCVDGQAASIHARLHRAVRTAQGGARLHSGYHLRRCKRRQGANRQEAGGRDCRSNRSGARAARRELPRGEKGGVHTARRAGSGPAARQAGMWDRERGEREKGFRIVAPSRCRLLQAAAGSCRKGCRI